MAHFRAIIRGNRREASRCGTKYSGIRATVNGWNIGVLVEIRHEVVDGIGEDVIRVYKTGGSSGEGRRNRIAKIRESVVSNPLMQNEYER